jgi:hypothetical protein
MLPELKPSKLDVDAIFDLQKGNLIAMQESHSVVLDAVQSIIRLNYGYVREMAASLQAMAEATYPTKPDAVIADVQAVTQKPVSIARPGIDVDVDARQRVVELVGQRVTASVDELKTIAA